VAGLKIVDLRRSRAVLNTNDVITIAKEELASQAPTFAKNELVCAGTQKDVPHNTAVIDDGFLAGTAENRDGGSFDQAGIFKSRGQVRIGHAIALQHIQLDRRRSDIRALYDTGSGILNERIVARHEDTCCTQFTEVFVQEGTAIRRDLPAVGKVVAVAEHDDARGAIAFGFDYARICDLAARSERKISPDCHLSRSL